MTGLTGISPKGPNKYLGPNVYTCSVVTRNRAPTTADYLQPETGKYYPFATLWLVGKNPTTGTYGDIWYLSNIVANAGNWIQFSSGGSGPLLEFTVPNGVSPIVPNGAGIVQLTSSGGTLTITGVGTNQINFDLAGGSVAADTFAGDTGTAVPTALGLFNIVGGAPLSAGTNGSVTSATGNTLTVTSINCAKWIVDPTANRGTHQTITAAMAAASSGETIFVRPGTYTENFTWKAGVDIVAFDADALTPNVIILGTATISYTGIASASGIQFKTNGAAAIAISGTGVGQLNLTQCTINGNDAKAITCNNANFSARITNSRVTTSSNNLAFAVTSSNGIDFRSCEISAGTNPNTVDARGVNFFNCKIESFTMLTTGTGSININNCFSNASNLNQTILTTSGTGTATVRNSSLFSGSASTISVGAGTEVTCTNSSISSSNTNAITGAGTLNYGGLVFIGSSSTINTTTQNGAHLQAAPGTSAQVLTSNGPGVPPTYQGAVVSNYSEGTFTPQFQFGGLSTGITYSVQEGRYTRIGNVLMFSIYMDMSSKGSATGNVTIAGFPFDIGGISSQTAFVQFDIVTYDAGFNAPFLRPLTGVTRTAEIWQSGDGVNGINLDDTNFDNNSNIRCQGFYFI